jgi:hypothetical protein
MNSITKYSSMIKSLEFILQSLNCIKYQVLLHNDIRECSDELEYLASSRKLT